MTPITKHNPDNIPNTLPPLINPNVRVRIPNNTIPELIPRIGRAEAIAISRLTHTHLTGAHPPFYLCLWPDKSWSLIPPAQTIDPREIPPGRLSSPVLIYYKPSSPPEIKTDSREAHRHCLEHTETLR